MIKHPITKIISGGQTGADRGGIAAGKILGLETGGTAPPGFMTDIGRDFSLRLKFGLVEGEADSHIYPKRTRKNVADSDGTALFGNMSSPGCRLTIRCCQKLKKPYCINPDSSQLVQFVHSNNIAILNIAGNRERTNPGIFNRVKGTILGAFAERR